jgi:hypothetical protein
MSNDLDRSREELFEYLEYFDEESAGRIVDHLRQGGHFGNTLLQRLISQRIDRIKFDEPDLTLWLVRGAIAGEIERWFEERKVKRFKADIEWL